MRKLVVTVFLAVLACEFAIGCASNSSEFGEHPDLDNQHMGGEHPDLDEQERLVNEKLKKG